MVRVKLEGSDIWEGCMPKEKYEEMKKEYSAELSAAREEAENYIINNLARIKKIVLEDEDGEQDATMADLKVAIKVAKPEELKEFIKTGRIPSDEAYSILQIKFKRGTK